MLLDKLSVAVAISRETLIRIASDVPKVVARHTDGTQMGLFPQLIWY